MNTNEIAYYASQIEKLHKKGSYVDITSLLTDLEKTSATLEQIQTTDIIKALYRLIKSCPAENVKNMGRSLLSKWKKMYRSSLEQKSAEKEETSGAQPSLSNSKEPNETTIQHNESLNMNEKQLLASNTDKHEVTEESDAFSAAETTNSVALHHEESSSALRRPDGEEDRQTTVSQNTTEHLLFSDSTQLRSKCVHLILQALTPNQPLSPDKVNKLKELGQYIEAGIYAIHGRNQLKYKSCVRSKVSNLKNPNSPHLRQELMSGLLTPDSFARMSVEEMAGMELRRLRESYTASGITEHQLPETVEGTATRKVRCRNCDAMDCRVTQVSRGLLFLPSWVQSGSTDNDSMTFMTCAQCGEQWYHSSWVCL